MTAHDDLEIMTFDVRTAFLYGQLAEDIHMDLPERVEIHESPSTSTTGSSSSSSNVSQENKVSERANFVCKLDKALYGLKQAPRCWNHRFKQFLSKLKFTECKADSYVFVGMVESSI